MMMTNPLVRPRLLAVLLAIVALLGGVGSARATELSLGASLCHASAPVPAAGEALPPAAAFACTGAPGAYQHGTLWLRADMQRLPIDPNDFVLMVHDTRFDRLEVAFLYADGAVRRQAVRNGDFGPHWRAGGQIAFVPPMRDAPPVAVILRFDRLASASLLRVRLLDTQEGGRQATAMAATVGAALMLLLIGTVYNASLAVAVRRQFPAWQAGWAGCMVLWGALWSHLPLFFFPGLAGALTSQICTALACLAVTLATQSAVTALPRRTLPRPARRATLALGTAVGLLGVPLALMRSGPIDALASVISLMILADLAAVTLCMTLAWRRGSVEARAFAGAWAFPMLALGMTQFVRVDGLFWGGGAQILVLFAAAWQTVWLSIAATRTLGHLRVERDRARHAEAYAHELARRDPLTGLRNRRGLLEVATPMLDRAREAGTPVALLILDVDRFKTINDAHGHEVGDRVLSTIAHRLERWDGDLCAVGRFGGEEFALMVGGLAGLPLARFAESVRQGIAACDHGAPVDGRAVTVSIGVAEAQGAAEFRRLYRLADAALYLSKRQGRNRVTIRALADEAGPDAMTEDAGAPDAVAEARRIMDAG